MNRKQPLRKYKVRMQVEGEVERMVMAASEEDAIIAAKKLVLDKDGMTPKKDALNAFCWNIGHIRGDIHWSDMTKEERHEYFAGGKAVHEQNQGENHDQERSD